MSITDYNVSENNIFTDNISFIYDGKEYSNLFVDFNRVCTKYLRIVCNVSNASNLIITYGPTKDFLNFSLKIELKKGTNIYTKKDYITCRYMQLELKSKADEKPVICTIDTLEFTNSQLPLSPNSVFASDDSTIDRIWRTGVYTVQLCLQKNAQSCTQKRFQLSNESIDFIENWNGITDNYVIFDGPRRDREAWLGDIRTEALTLYYAFGNYENVKDTLNLFFDLQNSEGWTYGSAATRQCFLEYNLWFIIALWEYYLYSGDVDYICEKSKDIKRLISYLLNNLNENHFIYSDASWMWTFPREGFSSAVQCILYKALVDGSKIFDAVNDKDFSLKLDSIRLLLKDNINKHFWDNEKGIYTDVLGFSETTIPVFLDVNSYAVAFGIAEKEQSNRVLSYLKNHMWTRYGSTTIDTKIEKATLAKGLKKYAFKPLLENSNAPDKDLIFAIYPHNKQVWPFMNGYEVEAHFKNEAEIDAINLIKKCWGNKQYNETGTFWEMFDIDSKKFATRPFSQYDESDCFNSECHGWSGWVSAIIQKYLLGVKPSKPGFEEVIIEPHPGNIKAVSGSVPTPQGIIFVDLKFSEKKCLIKVKYPKSIKVTILTTSSAFKNYSIEVEEMFT